MTTQLKRIQSIDVFRALTMLWMIFVNDLWSLTDIPRWLEHAPAKEDFLGFADVVFPCFLFLVGMAIPYAIQNRQAQGDSPTQLVRHIVMRSIALLVMGVFTVNVPDLNVQATGIGSEWFQIMMVAGFFLIWNLYPKSVTAKRWLLVGLQGIGVCLLVYLAFVFRGGEPEHLQPMRPQWWGILGLIGWTYLVCALLDLVTHHRPLWLLLVWAFFTLMTIAGHAGWLRMLWPNGPSDWILGNGAFHSFASAGLLATCLLQQNPKLTQQTRLIALFAAIGLGFLVAGFVARHFFIISKIQATPTWVFLCCGIAFLLYALLYWLVDRKGKAHWFAFIKVAGTSTLTCYLVPYVG